MRLINQIIVFELEQPSRNIRSIHHNRNYHFWQFLDKASKRHTRKTDISYVYTPLNAKKQPDS